MAGVLSPRKEVDIEAQYRFKGGNSLENLRDKLRSTQSQIAERIVDAGRLLEVVESLHREMGKLDKLPQWVSENHGWTMNEVRLFIRVAQLFNPDDSDCIQPGAMIALADPKTPLEAIDVCRQLAKTHTVTAVTAHRVIARCHLQAARRLANKEDPDERPPDRDCQPLHRRRDRRI